VDVPSFRLFRPTDQHALDFDAAHKLIESLLQPVVGQVPVSATTEVEQYGISCLVSCSRLWGGSAALAREVGRTIPFAEPQSGR